MMGQVIYSRLHLLLKNMALDLERVNDPAFHTVPMTTTVGLELMQAPSSP